MFLFFKKSTSSIDLPNEVPSKPQLLVAAPCADLPKEPPAVDLVPVQSDTGDQNQKESFKQQG